MGGELTRASIRRPMHVTLPDATRLELTEGATGADAAAAIGPGLARAALAVTVDGELRDLSAPLPDGASLEVVTDRSPQALELIRHDAAHVLATAVMELYPGVKISIGPPIEQGFYYDFEFPDGAAVSDADLERIEARMREHIEADEPFVRDDVAPARGPGALRARGPGLQGGADRGSGPRPGSRDGLAVHQRALHRPVPGPPRALHQAHKGVQAAVAGRGLLARRRLAHPADPHLRHRLPVRRRPGGAPGAPGAGPRARPPAHRARSWSCS